MISFIAFHDVFIYLFEWFCHCIFISNLFSFRKTTSGCVKRFPAKSYRSKIRYKGVLFSLLFRTYSYIYVWEAGITASWRCTGNRMGLDIWIDNCMMSSCILLYYAWFWVVEWIIHSFIFLVIFECRSFLMRYICRFVHALHQLLNFIFISIILVVIDITF